MRKKKKTVAVCGVLLAAALSLGGCSTKGGLKVVLTGGLSRNELISVNKAAMTLPEAKLLLMTELARYRNLYGEEMLSRQFGGQTLEESVKESTLDLMGKLLVMDEMADKYQIRLNEEDTANILSASAEYMDTLTETEKAFTGASESDVQHLFEKALLADRVYAELTGEQTIEVSDDEARVMKFKQIYTADAAKAQNYMAQLQAGADFESLAQTANEADTVDINVNRTTFSDDVSQQLFALTDGGVSNIIEIDGGYYIFYCSSAFDAELTEAHKMDVLEKRMSDAVTDTYADYMSQLSSKENQDVWSEVTVDTSLKLESASFMEVYQQYFPAKE